MKRWPPTGSMWIFTGNFRPRVFPESSYESAYLVDLNEIVTVIRGNVLHADEGVFVITSNHLAVGTVSSLWFDKIEENERIA